MISVNLGGLLVDEETDPAAAEMRLRAGLAWAQETGHLRAQAIGLNNLATLVTDQGDLPQARRLLEESLQLRRTLGDRRGVGVTLNNLGDVEAEEGHLERAYAFYAESFAIRARLGDRRGALIPALNLARIFCLEEAWQKAVGILGFAAQAQADMGIQLALDARRAEKECGANARSALGEVARRSRCRQSTAHGTCPGGRETVRSEWRAVGSCRSVAAARGNRRPCCTAPTGKYRGYCLRRRNPRR